MIYLATTPVHIHAQTITNKGQRIHAVTAALVYNLVKYIERNAPVSNEFNVCVAGTEALIEEFNVYNGKLIHTQPLRIISSQSSAFFFDCQILFVSGAYSKHFNKRIEELNDSAVITISDQEYAIDQGYMVGFTDRNGQIEIELNLQIMRMHKFDINPALIEIATRVIN